MWHPKDRMLSGAMIFAFQAPAAVAMADLFAKEGPLETKEQRLQKMDWIRLNPWFFFVWVWLKRHLFFHRLFFFLGGGRPRHQVTF